MHMVTRAMISLLALGLAGCDSLPVSPLPSPTAAAAPVQTEAPATTAPNPIATALPSPSASAAAGAFVSVQNGVRVEVAPATPTIEAGQGVTVTVSLTNELDRPLQFGTGPCFVYLDVLALMPLEPGGRDDWPGRYGEFKNHVLMGGPSSHVYYEPFATGVRLNSDDCANVNGMTSPLAPGATTTASFHWAGSFEEALPDPPQSATFQALVQYSASDSLVTEPPPTTCPCSRWYPRLEDLQVSGTIAITGKTRTMASLGQVLDGALASASLRTFIDHHHVEDCIVNFNLPYDQGLYLPAGPGWDLEVLCLHPRRYVYLEIDPWTAKIKGERVCNVSCWR